MVAGSSAQTGIDRTHLCRFRQSFVFRTAAVRNLAAQTLKGAQMVMGASPMVYLTVKWGSDYDCRGTLDEDGLRRR
jgi:hypothetical protein